MTYVPDSTLIAALLGIFGTVVAGVIGWVTSRMRLPVTEAEAKLANAQAADLLIGNLHEQYQQTTERLAAVETRLSMLEQRFVLARGVVAALPEEHQKKFDEVFAPLPLSDDAVGL